MSDPGVEPPLEGLAFLPPGQQQDAESQLAEHDGIDDDVVFVGAQPREHARIGGGSGRLAQDVRVDQVLHSVSVDSDVTGTKKPFAGQASNQSTTPSFARTVRRMRR